MGLDFSLKSKDGQRFFLDRRNDFDLDAVVRRVIGKPLGPSSPGMTVELSQSQVTTIRRFLEEGGHEAARAMSEADDYMVSTGQGCVVFTVY